MLSPRLRAALRPLLLLLSLAAQPASGLHLPSAHSAPQSARTRLGGGAAVPGQRRELLLAFAPSTGPAAGPRRGVSCSPSRALRTGSGGKSQNIVFGRRVVRTGFGGKSQNIVFGRRVVCANDKEGKDGKEGKGGGQDEDEEDLTPIDKLFKPLVREYAKLGDEEQKVLAAVYQSLYFILCIYVGVVMVRAYKAWYFGGGGGF